MSLRAPKYRSVTIDADSADQSFSPPLDSIVIGAVGVLEYDDDIGTTHTLTIPAAVTDKTTSGLPFTLETQIARIDTGNTTIPSANMMGQREI